ncbi:MAG: hypothetical protein Q8P13_01865 [bacterium]|nr:hypothetical protein [bacterium]
MEEARLYKANAILWAAGTSLWFFAILNIFKEAFAAVKGFLNFFPSVGPLLGLFLFSSLVLLASYFLFQALKPKSQKAAFWFFLVSSILFFFLVFPLVFEPIVDILANK